MRTELRPQVVKRCTHDGCGEVFQMSGDTAIRLIKPVHVPMDGTKAARGKCPRHERDGDDD